MHAGCATERPRDSLATKRYSRMIPIRLCHLATLTLVLLLAQSTAFTDYTSTTLLADGQTAVGGLVQVEGYDGQGTPGGGLGAGQVRITVNAGLSNPPWGNDPPPPGTVWMLSGLQDFSIPTTLNLNSNQITMGPGWSVSAGGGMIEAFQMDPTQLSGTATMLISGLGANAIASNFGAPGSWGSGIGLDWTLEDAEPIPPAPSSTPEPSTLVLGAVAVAGWLGRRTLRRRMLRHSA